MIISSLFNSEQWNRAEWGGVGFAVRPDGPPAALFIFKNEQIGKDIFSALKERFKGNDQREEIRLSFIRGVDASNEHTYAIHFGSSPEAVADRLSAQAPIPDGTRLITDSKIYVMRALGPSILDGFEQAYRRFGGCIITNAMTRNGMLGPDMNNLIAKKSVLFRKAADITGKTDLDYAATEE